MTRALYAEVRDRMRPGDVIAFGGKGRLSDVIKWVTRGPVSHVGVVLHTQLAGADRRCPYFNQVVEATSLDGMSGVTISRLSRRLAVYTGDVWWLPLGDDVRGRLDERALIEFLLAQEGKPYDVPQALLAGLDLFGGITAAAEDFSRFFCSELIAAALEAAGAIAAVNASEVTPMDLVRWRIYAADYYQLGGAEGALRGFNRLDPAAWATA